MHLLESPPLGLYVVVIVCDVRILHVGPVSDAVRHELPLVLVLPHGLLALLDERLYAVILYLRLAVQPQRLLHFKLHRKPVRVPACLPQNMLPFHGLVPGDYVFHAAREDVADVRLAVCRRGAVVKRELLSPFVLLHRLLKDAVFFPELDHILLPVHEIEGCVHLLVQCHNSLLEAVQNGRLASIFLRKYYAK